MSCSTGWSGKARRKACRRPASTSVPGPRGAWLLRRPRAPISVRRAWFRSSPRTPSARSPRWSPTEKRRRLPPPPIRELVYPRPANEATGDSELLRQLQEIPVAQRASFITEFLQREVQGFLRLAPPPAPTRRFLDLGTGSLLRAALRT